MVTLSPLFFSNLPNDAAVIPLPSEETTPPVTKIYLVTVMIPSMRLCYILSLPKIQSVKACKNGEMLQTFRHSNKKSDTRSYGGTFLFMHKYMRYLQPNLKPMQ